MTEIDSSSLTETPLPTHGEPGSPTADAVRDFVVHLADEDTAEPIHRCGERHPSHGSEHDVIGFTTLQ